MRFSLFDALWGEKSDVCINDQAHNSVLCTCILTVDLTMSGKNTQRKKLQTCWQQKRISADGGIVQTTVDTAALAIVES